MPVYFNFVSTVGSILVTTLRITEPGTEVLLEQV